MSLLREEMLSVLLQKLMGGNNDTSNSSRSSSSLGISEEGKSILLCEIEFRVRQMIDSSAKFAAASKRSDYVTCKDINDALKSWNVQPLYGFEGGIGSSSSSSSGNGNFTRIESSRCRSEDMEGKKEGEATVVFVPSEQSVILSAHEILKSGVVSTTASKKGHGIDVVPIAPSFNLHWLAVQGVQPNIPENDQARMEKEAACISSSSRRFPSDLMKKSIGSSEGSSVKPLVKHVLSEEMITYYEQVTDAITGQDADVQQAAFHSLSCDPGLQQLLPYLSVFLYDEMKMNLNNLPFLEAILQTIDCLMKNPSIRIEVYLHIFLPVILTCVLGKRLCENPSENHWALRDHGARLAAQICSKYGSSYVSLQGRICATYHEAFTNDSLPLTTHYGAILGMAYLGPHTMELLLFPSLESYLSRLEKTVERNNKNEVQRLEAQNCLGGLIHATGRYLQMCSHKSKNPMTLERFHLLLEAFGEDLIPYFVFNPMMRDKQSQSSILDTNKTIPSIDLNI